MNTEIQQRGNNLAAADQIPHDIISSLVINGDLSRLTPEQKVDYYNKFCNSLGLNPLTQPFEIIILNGKQRLYAKKDATEQLRRIYGVSVSELSHNFTADLCIVTAKGRDKSGRTDFATGAVSVKNLQGEALANAIMKAETKAKRRLTLSICGLGMLDETEVDDIPKSQQTAKNQHHQSDKGAALNVDVLDPNNDQHTAQFNNLLGWYDWFIKSGITHLMEGSFDVEAQKNVAIDKFNTGTLTIEFADKTQAFLQEQYKAYSQPQENTEY